MPNSYWNELRAKPIVALLFVVAGCSSGTLSAPVPGVPGDAARNGARLSAPETVLYSFGGPDGAGASNGMIADRAGAFYGTTLFGGIGGGTVFKFTPTASGYTESVLYTFKGGYDGTVPWGVLVERDGALYGVTLEGGDPNGNAGVGWGTVFKLTLGKAGYTESVLYRFRGGLDAWQPLGPVVFDRAGALYGASAFGGSLNDGTVFKLTPSESG